MIMFGGFRVFVWSVLVFVVFAVVPVTSIPNQRQTQELMLLDALGKRAGVGASTDFVQLFDLIGRSRLSLATIFYSLEFDIFTGLLN